MGFFDSIAAGLNDLIYEPTITNGVEGTGRVVAASEPSGDGFSLYAHCQIQLMVEAPGIPSHAVTVNSLVHHAHWPQEGAKLPVLIERDDPQEVVILWDKVPDETIQAMNAAEDVAAGHKTASARTVAANPYENDTFTGATVKIVGDASQIPPEAKAKLLAFGIDIDKLIAQS